MPRSAANGMRERAVSTIAELSEMDELHLIAWFTNSTIKGSAGVAVADIAFFSVSADVAGEGLRRGGGPAAARTTGCCLVLAELWSMLQWRCRKARVLRRGDALLVLAKGCARSATQQRGASISPVLQRHPEKSSRSARHTIAPNLQPTAALLQD